MSNWNVRRGILSVRLLCGLAEEFGLPPITSLRGSGIDPARLADPTAEISAEQECRVISNLLRGLGAQGIEASKLGILAGLRYHVTTMGIWGFAMASSASLRGAWEVGMKYLDLTYSVNRVWLEEDENGTRAILDETAAPPELGEFLILRDVAAIQLLSQEMRGTALPVRRLALRYPRPRDVQPFIDTFGLLPGFNAPRNLFELDRRVFDAPLPQANELMRQACEEQCRQLLARRRSRGGLAGRVRDRLLRMPSTMPDMETVATELHMTARHLRRLLETEGTSYRALVDEVRQALAEELLTTARMKMEEVASRLGYAERTSFAHAFKRWKGTSPGSYRR
jgi:AraC-like DNA-binding protein